MTRGGGGGGRVVLVGALLAAATMVVPSSAIAAPAPSAAPAGATAARPLYFERIVTDADLEGRSADELRLMRNTIFARTGRPFEDPALRDYFSRQPWYRASAGPPRKLTAVEVKNLAGIKLWETRAKAVEALQRLVPGFDERAANRPRPECGVDARGVLRDKREARQLIVAAGRLPWAGVPNYEDIGIDALGTKMKAVRVDCGPDIDADGSPEAVVTLTRSYELAPGDEGAPESMNFLFLASRRGTKWHAAVPLGISGSIPGVEGSVGTSVWFVTLADGRKALAIRRIIGGGGDCACDSETVSVATLAHGQLQQRGSFGTGRPCECEYAGSE